LGEILDRKGTCGDKKGDKPNKVRDCSREGNFLIHSSTEAGPMHVVDHKTMKVGPAECL
jgi:hypothetical protein